MVIMTNTKKCRQQLLTYNAFCNNCISNRIRQRVESWTSYFDRSIISKSTLFGAASHIRATKVRHLNDIIHSIKFSTYTQIQPCYFVSQWKTNPSKPAKPLHLLLATIKTKTAPKEYTHSTITHTYKFYQKWVLQKSVEWKSTNYVNVNIVQYNKNRCKKEEEEKWQEGKGTEGQNKANLTKRKNTMRTEKDKITETEKCGVN